jgi:drug/metabolite transporter (DMT)-like permease
MRGAATILRRTTGMLYGWKRRMRWGRAVGALFALVIGSLLLVWRKSNQLEG